MPRAIGQWETVLVIAQVYKQYNVSNISYLSALQLLHQCDVLPDVEGQTDAHTQPPSHHTPAAVQKCEQKPGAWFNVNF